MDAPGIAAIRRIEAVAAVLASLPTIGAEAYAGGKYRAKGIVDRHFTAGNAARYGWPPLSRAYFLRKQHAAKALQQGMHAAGRVVSKLDPKASFRSSTGSLSGEGTGANLPMLVLTGKLRAAVANKAAHQITQSGDVATILFRNLPDYAEFLHEGTEKMPQRSPVLPNAEDREEMLAEMRKALSAAAGRGGAVPVSGTSVPGIARVIS